jgi:hypothetical protein
MAAELLRFWTRGESDIGAVIVNRTPLATIFSQSEIRAQVKCEILGMVPHDMELCANPLHKGVPLVVLHPDGVTAETLAALGKRLARLPDTAGAIAL